MRTLDGASSLSLIFFLSVSLSSREGEIKGKKVKSGGAGDLRVKITSSEVRREKLQQIIFPNSREQVEKKLVDMKNVFIYRITSSHLCESSKSRFECSRKSARSEEMFRELYDQKKIHKIRYK